MSGPTFKWVIDLGVRIYNSIITKLTCTFLYLSKVLINKLNV